VKFDSMFGAMEVYTAQIEDGKPVRVMDVGGAYQSAAYLADGKDLMRCGGALQSVSYERLAFDYHRAYETVRLAMPRATRVLALGGGGYAYPQFLVRNHAEVRVDVVEVDPVATAVARRYFGLDETLAECGERLRLIEGDGRAYLDGDLASFPNPGGYDLIVNDTFSGRTPALRLATVEAAELVKASLAPGGLYASNIISAVSGPEAIFLRDIAATLLEVFECVRVIPCEPKNPDERQNTVIVAGDSRVAQAPAAGTPFAEAPAAGTSSSGDSPTAQTSAAGAPSARIPVDAIPCAIEVPALHEAAHIPYRDDFAM
jgi:spermidine synthase